MTPQQEQAITLITTATEHYSDPTLWRRYHALVADRDWTNQPVTTIEREFITAIEKAAKREMWKFARIGLLGVVITIGMVWWIFS